MEMNESSRCNAPAIGTVTMGGQPILVCSMHVCAIPLPGPFESIPGRDRTDSHRCEAKHSGLVGPTANA